MSEMQNEAKAYIAAITVKDAFTAGVSAADLVPANLPKALARVTKARDQLDDYCYQMTTEELLDEFDATRRAMKGYLAVLTNLNRHLETPPENWEKMVYYLDPEAPVEVPPPLVDRQEAQDALERICNFSELSRAMLAENVAKRAAWEKARAAKRSGKGGKKGFFGKLGF